jgi:hypothetical protein
MDSATIAKIEAGLAELAPAASRYSPQSVAPSRENYSFFGRHGLLYDLFSALRPIRGAHFATLVCNARLEGSEDGNGPFFLDPPRAHQVFCPKSFGSLAIFTVIGAISSLFALVLSFFGRTMKSPVKKTNKSGQRFTRRRLS